MLSTPFEFQIVLTPKPMHHTESTTFVLSPQKFLRTVVKRNPRFDSGIRLRSCFVLPTAFPFGTDVLEADPGEDENTTRSRSNNRRKWLTF
jgi:hypothetical protein